MVDESTDIFFPISHVGCLIASFDFIFLNSEISRSMNGPPDAVIVKLLYLIYSGFLVDPYFKPDPHKIEVKHCAHYQLGRIEALDFF